MLSSKGIAAGSDASQYYDNLAKTDYYTAGGEPPGRWIGSGAERLELAGNVEKGELAAALAGFHPRTGEALAKNAGEKHRGGEDLCFSAPKSVSIAWAVGDEAARRALSDAQQRAVEKTIKIMEADGSFFTRHGAAGEERRAYTGGLVVATFEHSTSRNGDAQLHTHALAANITPDGRRVDFDTNAKHRSGAIYRIALADELREIGWKIERDGSSWRLAEIPKELERDFSSRRKEIERELRDKGMSGGKASAAATLATREKKGEVDREQLFAKAQLTAEKYDITPDKINELCRAGTLHEPREMPTHVDMASNLTARASTLTPLQFEAQVYQAAQGVTDLTGAREYLDQLKQSGEIIELRDSNGNTRYTSREMWEIESNLSARAQALALDKSHGLSREIAAAALEAKAQASMSRALANSKLPPAERAIIEQARGMAPSERAAWRETLPEDLQRTLRDVQGLSDEQRKAFDSLTSEGRLRVLEGTAGTGKSYLMDTCRDAWERAGYTVTGCALAGRAAEQLQTDSSIPSDTVHATLARLDAGKIVLTNKSVLVMDEAGMTGSRLMQRIQDHVDKAGAKLVIIGDTKQLQPVDNGGAMRAQRLALEQAGVPIAELNEIRRQREQAEREMVLSAKAGRGQDVVDYLQNKERIVVHETRDELLKALAAKTISDSQRVTDTGEKLKALAMAETNAETRQVNLYAREIAKERGLVDKTDAKFSAERGEREFSVGEPVYFLRNNRELGVKNGNLGTVTAAEDGKLSIKLNNSGKIVEFSQDKYNHVDHGYCATVHKSQGDTVDYATYAPGRMADRELSYVALSRHREAVEVHITKDQLEGLGKQFSRSNQKDTSADYERVQPHQGEIDRAQARIDKAAARITELEAKAAAMSAPTHNPHDQPTLKEQQHDRYANAASQRDVSIPGRGADSTNALLARPVPPISVHELRNLSSGDVFSGSRRLNEMPLLSNERHQLAVRRAESDRGMRRPGDGFDASEAQSRASGAAARTTGAVRSGERSQGGTASSEQGGSRRGEGSESRAASSGQSRPRSGERSQGGAASSREGGSRSSEKQLAKIERQLADARSDMGAAKASLAAAQAKQTAAIEKAKEPRPPAEPVRMTPATKEANAIRDGELARRALEAHRAGDKLPRGKDLETAIKRGDIKPTKDSTGQQYFENRKTGAIYAKSLNQAATSTTSRNLNHLGLTSTKYIDTGNGIIKSGGTLTSELAGKLRDMNRKNLEKGNAIEKFGAKTTDNALKKMENWQKAGAIESLTAKIQMKLEQRAAIKAATKDLEAKVKAAEQAKQPKAHEKTEQRQSARDEKSRDSENANDRPSDEIGRQALEKAEQLAQRAAPEPEKSAAQEASKTAERDAGYSR